MSHDFQPDLKPLPDGDAGVSRLPVPGFWLRAVALAGDLVLLTAVCYYLARFYYEQLYPLREYSQFGVALVVFVYFWIGQSSLTRGQTVGKRLVGIQVVGESGAYLSAGRAVVRGLFIFLIAFALQYLVITRVFGYSVLFVPARVPILLSILVLTVLAAGFSVCDAVYCGIHPKRRSLHDLLAKALVVRRDEVAAGVTFAENWGENDYVRLRLAKWPTFTMAVISVVLLIQVWSGVAPELRRRGETIEVASEWLDSPGFRLVDVAGPSTEQFDNFQRSLAEAQNERQSKGLDLLTSESLRLIPTGRKFHFRFLTEEYMTSVTLAADPGLDYILEQVPQVAEDLSARFFSDEEGRPAPYESVQVEFIGILPFYMYLEARGVWADLIPVSTGSVAGRE